MPHTFHNLQPWLWGKGESKIGAGSIIGKHALKENKDYPQSHRFPFPA